jgi:GNAT superfamily N-acetyltransferase
VKILCTRGPFSTHGVEKGPHRYGPAVAEELTIRAVTEEDVEALFGLILELAAYEKLSDEVTGDAAVLARSLFEERTAEALLAELGGEAVGYAILCGTFSSFECKGGIWIEDIYVRPESRRAGAGRALFARVAELAVERGFPRVEWAALDWNELAFGFYDRLGARRMDEWRMLRLEGEALERLGSPGR